MNLHRPAESRATQKQLTELLHPIRALVTGMITEFFLTLSYSEAKTLLRNKVVLLENIHTVLSGMLVVTADAYTKERAYWENIYAKHFGLDADFSGVPVPEKPAIGVWRLLFILEGLTLNHTLLIYRKILTAYHPPWRLVQYTEDLDKAIRCNTRTGDVSYIVWVRDEPKADEEFFGLSARQTDQDGCIGETLLERLVHGTVYFIETREHLDSEGITLCSGSRSADGRIPGVRWDFRARKVDIDLYDLEYSVSGGGVRQAVTLSKTV